LIAAIDKLGIRAGFSYTWGHAESSQYTVQCNDPKNNHPCVETFSPMIGVISGIGYVRVPPHILLHQQQHRPRDIAAKKKEKKKINPKRKKERKKKRKKT
jgi:hypothetical protein